VNFEWDAEKAAANLEKHKVSFHDAPTVFTDSLSTTFPDPGHSEGERRFITIGASQSGALLVIAHTEQDDTIRLISARRVTGHERKFYEEAKD
jgi:uncharacterized DUF497 family protein